MADVTPQPERSGLALAHRILVVALPLVVLVQAVIAGQHLFEGMSITVHGILGNITFAMALVGVLLTVVRRGDGVAFFLAVTLMTLSFAQIGLGYVGRDTTLAAAWHVPIGVTIFGLACFQLSLLRR